MRFLVAFVFGVLLLLDGGSALADAPSTRPAAPMVIVYRFDVVGDSDHAWVGQAIQEGISSAISQAGTFNSKTSAVIPASVDDAVRNANSGKAACVIVGTCQIVEDQIRVTGSVIDVASGKTLGGLHTTGALKDLFSLEDALASQSNRLLSPTPRVAENVPPPAIDLNNTMAVYQPKYFEEDIRDELVVPDPNSAAWQHYSNSRYPCDYGYGCYGSYRCYLWGRACFGGCGRWYPTAQPLSTW